MLPEQAIPHLGYGPTLLIIRCLDGKIAFGVQSHGTIVQIGGADTQDLIIDDDDLGMDEDFTSAILSCYHGIIEPQPVMPISQAHMPDKSITVGSHYETLERPR